jgi:hypothetical protein
MKALAFLLVLVSISSFADIPTGKYRLEKIQCKSGKVLKLGGKFMQYNVTLDVTDADMKMTAIAKSADWAPFKLNCTQINFGKFSYSGDSQFSGSLPMTSVKCNAKTWENILRKQLFGVEAEGVFTYNVSGNKLTIENSNTITKYSCEKTNSYPVYHYTK